MIIYDIKWAATTAGPTPKEYKNQRIELFLFGCKKAIEGNPCPGCFNPALWNSSVATKTHNPADVAEHIVHSQYYNGYVTIGGGEPTDQLNELIELCKNIKALDPKSHIMVYTWHDLYNEKLFEDENFSELFSYIDMIVDGEYKQDQRLYNESSGDGFTSSIGSANQTVWSKQDENIWLRVEMGQIKSIELDTDNTLIYTLKAVE